MDSPLLPLHRNRPLTPADQRRIDRSSFLLSHVLNHLRTHVNSPRSVNELIEAVYPDPNDEPAMADDCIRLSIMRLRLRGFDIRTVWGRGYMLFALPQEKDHAYL